jgi:peptide chain release factor 1
MSFADNLDRLVQHFHDLSDLLAKTTVFDPQDFARLSKEYSDLNDIIPAVQQFQDTQRQYAELGVMLHQETDPELRFMIEEEYFALKESLPNLEHAVKILLLPKDLDDERNAILEVRAGTGGEEAGLFAADLFRMYQRYAVLKQWKFDIVSMHENGIGSIREATASICGKGVFARLKFESGVHRVQRVPTTEASGRIHTSTATVAVLPEVEEVDIQIDEKDLQIDVFRASGAGGQHVNKTESAIRITHLPSGIVVAQQDDRSQHKNKAQAMKILRSRLYDQEKAKKMDAQAQERRSQVGSGDRSERIRTYNVPQGRVSDHRINLTLYKIQLILEGEALDELIDALMTHDQAERLSISLEI